MMGMGPDPVRILPNRLEKKEGGDMEGEPAQTSRTSEK
jgi:hypothetical protein